MDVLKALVITFISFNSQLFGQPLVQVREDSNVLSVPFTVDIISANFNTIYISNVSMEQQRVFVYRYNETNKTTAIRVSTFSTEAQDDFPITFVVREQEDILSWMIPVSAGFDYKFPSMDRTLCPMDETKRLNLTSPQRVYVIVDTMSDTIRSFSLNATILPDFELVHGQDRELTASPSQPQYYMYTFPKDVDTVFLRVTSNSDLCAVISVQPIQCPVLDLDEDIGTLGKHQTMTTKATFFLERIAVKWKPWGKSLFNTPVVALIYCASLRTAVVEENGRTIHFYTSSLSETVTFPLKSDYHRFQAFYVIVLVKPKLPRCSAPDDIPPQERLNVTTKNLSILITNTMSSSEIDWKIGVVILIYAGVSAAIFLPCCIVGTIARCKNTSWQTGDTCRRMKIKTQKCFRIIFCGQEQTLSDTSRKQLRSSQHAGSQATSDSQLGSGQHSSSPGMDPQASTSNARNIEDIDGEGDTSDVAPLQDAGPDSDVTSNQTVEAPLNRFVSTESYNETAKVCLWILGTITLFYGLPAVQLVLTYQKKMNENGDEDLCYYNFECAYPVRWLGYEIRSFNSFISNIGYVFLGIFFLFLVFLRNFLHTWDTLDIPIRQNHNGMLKHFGLLYAMGFALIVEGVMSACYHICPTYSNYQFDTSFMYAITSLCILKIYESRHPDAQIKAHRHYFCMGVYTCFAVLGIIFDEHWGVWVLYASLHGLCVIAVVIIVCTKGIIEGDQHGNRCNCCNCCSCTCHAKCVFKVWLVLMVMFNLALAAYGAGKRKPDFATYLLIILLVNLLCYLLLHIVMKGCCDGRIDICNCTCSWKDICSCICRLLNRCTCTCSWKDICSCICRLFNRCTCTCSWKDICSCICRLFNRCTCTCSWKDICSCICRLFNRCTCTCSWKDIRSCICRLFNRCTVFTLAAIIMWGVAISYFVSILSSWELSPEESRTKNMPCVLDFYDYHDIWHFLSAGAIFFSFMVLLTLDDDLDNRPRNTIFIF
ncbi:SID1 transmembrane family member 2-like isoform X2 [Pomacea canaliculata]|uniref:SID1 transmembrane family member 2-like isoform X2 n=1 Tax=Pomacea canaliculata TaxID=400727 RepID=UPI000D72A15E|nr:SID1 transmembrane family member 2-like isoform X2 [Pomacea canaliculata]